MKKIKGITIALLLIHLTACKDHLPIEGTPEHFALHGVVNDGNTINEIRVFDPRLTTPVHLRFPASSWVGVTTQGWSDSNPVKIRKGYATQVFTYRTLDLNLNLVDKDKVNDSATLIIYYETSNSLRTRPAYGTNSPSRVIGRDINEWGLQEYVSKRGDVIEGRFEHIPIESNFQWKNAGRVWMECNVAGTTETDRVPSACFAYFQQAGLSVEFDFDFHLMPY